MTAAPALADSRVLRLRRTVRKVRARVQGLAGVIRLLSYALLGRLDEIWVGDSHAVHVNSRVMVTALRRMPSGRWIWHLGPRIMFSVAREGLPPAVLRVMGLISHTRRARDIVWVFSFGGIDVRCHLVPRMQDSENALAFVPRYLERIQEAATRAGARRALVLIPPPESDAYPGQLGFPIAGTLAERTEVNLALRSAMMKAVVGLPADGPAISLIDVTEDFSDERGECRVELTYDGLHTNEVGAEIIHTRVREILARD